MKGAVHVRRGGLKPQGNTMKLTPVLFAAAAALAMMSAPASANEVEDACTAALSAEGADTSICACLGEAADADADVAANILSLAGMDAAEREANTSEATAAAIADCQAG